MNVRDSCTVIIRIKLTAPLLCPGSNAHIFCSIPIRPPLDFHPKIPEGIPVALGAIASGTSLLLMQSHHLPGKTTHYQRLRPRSHVESTCFHVHDAAVLTQGQLWCLSWLCPSLHRPVSGGGPSQLCMCSVPSLPGCTSLSNMLSPDPVWAKNESYFILFSHFAFILRLNTPTT